RSPAPAVRGVREAAHAVVDELTPALDEPVGVEQHAVARLEHQVRLGHRWRVPQPQHRTEDPVREAGAFGVDEKRRWVPGAGPGQLARGYVEDGAARAAGLRVGNAAGEPV